MQRIKKGDEVIVIAGKDKGRRGKVGSVLADGHVIVEGVNLVKKHQKGNPNTGATGGIVEKEMPLPLCKVALWNPASKKGDRVGVKKLADGKRVRFFKSNGEVIDV